MAVYQFVLKSTVSKEPTYKEHLGCLDMANDDEATTFAGPIVHDLTQDSENYSGIVLEIISGNRRVAGLPLSPIAEFTPPFAEIQTVRQRAAGAAKPARSPALPSGTDRRA